MEVPESANEDVEGRWIEITAGGGGARGSKEVSFLRGRISKGGAGAGDFLRIAEEVEGTGGFASVEVEGGGGARRLRRPLLLQVPLLEEVEGIRLRT